MTGRSLPTARVHDLLASPVGLTSDEARERRRRYGVNDIVEAPPGRWRDLARDTLRDPMLWFLAGVSALYAAIGDHREALTLLAAIVPLMGMDAFLHHRTRASTEGLRSRLADRATVLRDGAPVEIPALDVVPGDLALVSPGDAFPADGVVLEGTALQVDESSLTGEAYPVAKRPLVPPPAGAEDPPVAAEQWALAGTRLLTGRAAVRVAFTGGETRYGEIVRSAAQSTRARTPLQGAIQHLVAVLLGAAAVICGLLALVRLAQGHDWLDALLSAVTLAAAAIPEEFPVAFTFFLGVAVYRLARRQALVRRAVAVENIGRITTICSDKTGTITAGRLHLTHLVAAGLQPERELLALAALAARGDSRDPVDEAVCREAAAAGVLPAAGEALTTFPFTEARRRETVIVRDTAGRFVAVTKGAAETVLSMSAPTDAEREVWLGHVVRLAGAGHKVLACASRSLDADAAAGAEPEAGFRMAGLLAFEDPVRDGVTAAIEACRQAGIHVIMVTGDHPLTARAVAREIGLGGDTPRVLTGDALETLVDRGERQALRDVDVIARAAPGQKLILVRALQELGDIVAVTGDGVNDVPALQAADIGIAMGERGTRSAREVAAIVLLDDNFATIVGAIAEGRQLFQNLRLSFEYLLIFHLPFVLSALVVPLLGYPLLYLPVHIVVVELLIHPTALLVFQDLPAGRLSRAPSRGRARFFSRREWLSIALVGGVIGLVVVGGYVWNVEERGSAEHGRAMAMATLALGSAAVAAALSGLRGRAARVIAAATVMAGVSIVAIAPLARALHLAPLHLVDWAVALAASVGTGALLLTLARITGSAPR